ncbi:MAG: succinate dehydrogenase, hydrophobic membrane anchor protein [Aestuariivirga sp.]
MSMKTELGKVRGLGAAHNGTQDFFRQRVTAIANVPLTLYILYFVIAHLGEGRDAVVASIKNPFAALALCLALISICWHMKLGLQMVIEDYVHGQASKMMCLILNIFFAFGLCGLGILAILKMSFGA